MKSHRTAGLDQIGPTIWKAARKGRGLRLGKPLCGYNNNQSIAARMKISARGRKRVPTLAKINLPD